MRWSDVLEELATLEARGRRLANLRRVARPSVLPIVGIPTVGMVVPIPPSPPPSASAARTSFARPARSGGKSRLGRPSGHQRGRPARRRDQDDPCCLQRLKRRRDRFTATDSARPPTTSGHSSTTGPSGSPTPDRSHPESSPTPSTTSPNPGGQSRRPDGRRRYHPGRLRVDGTPMRGVRPLDPVRPEIRRHDVTEGLPRTEANDCRACFLRPALPHHARSIDTQKDGIADAPLTFVEIAFLDVIGPQRHSRCLRPGGRDRPPAGQPDRERTCRLWAGISLTTPF